MESSQLTAQRSEAQLRTAYLENQVALLTSQLDKSSLENANLRNQIETLESRSVDFDERLSILSRALFKQLAEKRVAQSTYDIVTANVLDTPQRVEEAMTDIMFNTEQHGEIKSFVEEALKKRIRRVTAGDFTGRDIRNAMDVPMTTSTERNFWEVCLGHEGTTDYSLHGVLSPKFHNTSLLERFAASESAEMDNTVGRLTRQGAESLRTARSSVLPSSTLGGKMEQYDWDNISQAASSRLSQHIKDQLTTQAEKRRGMLASGQGTMGGLEVELLPWYKVEDKSLQLELFILSNDGYFESTGVPTAIDLRSTVFPDFESFRES